MHTAALRKINAEKDVGNLLKRRRIPLVDVCHSFSSVAGLGKDIPVAMAIKGEEDADQRVVRLAEQIAALGAMGHTYKMGDRDTLSQGNITVTTMANLLARPLWQYRGPEIRDFAIFDGTMFVSERNIISVLDIASRRKVREIRHEKLMLNHTLDFKESDPKQLLVASTGADRIFFVNIDTDEIIWEWNPWRHGYKTNVLGLTLVEKGDPLPEGNVQVLEFSVAQEAMQSGKSLAEGKCLVHIVDYAMKRPKELLHVWERNAGPNVALLGKYPQEIFASLARAGHIIKIAEDTQQTEILLAGLVKPHGPAKTNNGYVVNDTGHGHVLFVDDNFELMEAYNFGGFPCRVGLENRTHEWIQNTHPIADNLLATVDSRRNTIFVWDPSKGIFTAYPFAREVVVQAVKPVFNF